MENEYKPNSNRFKESQRKEDNKQELKRIEKVVAGPVKTRKKSKFSKFTEEFISEDAKNVKSYVFGEVLIPAIKKAISDIVTDGIDIILYGEYEGWFCTIFSHIGVGEYPYNTASGNYGWCIPYNDETKHLVGTTDEAPEFYKYWED